MQPFDLVITGNGRTLDRNSVDGNPVGEQQLQHVLVAGVAAVFASIADDKNNPAALFVALAQIESGRQNSVIQYVRFLFRSVNNGSSRLFWNTVDGGTLRPHGTAGDRGTVIVAPLRLQIIQCRLQLAI